MARRHRRIGRRGVPDRLGYQATAASLLAQRGRAPCAFSTAHGSAPLTRASAARAVAQPRRLARAIDTQWRPRSPLRGAFVDTGASCDPQLRAFSHKCGLGPTARTAWTASRAYVSPRKPFAPVYSVEFWPTAPITAPAASLIHRASSSARARRPHRPWRTAVRGAMSLLPGTVRPAGHEPGEAQDERPPGRMCRVHRLHCSAGQVNSVTDS